MNTWRRRYSERLLRTINRNVLTAWAVEKQIDGTDFSL